MAFDIAIWPTLNIEWLEKAEKNAVIFQNFEQIIGHLALKHVRDEKARLICS